MFHENTHTRVRCVCVITIFEHFTSVFGGCFWYFINWFSLFSLFSLPDLSHLQCVLFKYGPSRRIPGLSIILGSLKKKTTIMLQVLLEIHIQVFAFLKSLLIYCYDVRERLAFGYFFCNFLPEVKSKVKVELEWLVIVFVAGRSACLNVCQRKKTCQLAPLLLSSRPLPAPPLSNPFSLTFSISLDRSQAQDKEKWSTFHWSFVHLVVAHITTAQVE